MEFYEAVLVLVLTLSFVAGLGYLLVKIYSNWAPGNRKIRDILREWRKEAASRAERMVPWTPDEMELFSLNHKRLTTTGFFGKETKGLFKSIYHEPMLFYAYREFISGSRNAVLYIRTTKHEWTYRIKKGRIGVNFNEDSLGWIGENSEVLYGTDENKTLAKVNRDGRNYRPITIEEKEVAHLVNPDAAERYSARVFHMIDEDISDREESLMMSIAAYQLVLHQLENTFDTKYFSR